MNTQHYPTEHMPQQEPHSPLTLLCTMFLAVLASVAPIATGCARKAGGRNDDKTSTVSVLGSLLLEGHELHSSLRTEPLESISDLPPDMLLPKNPHLSSDDKFVALTARGGSQGRLDGEGMRSALYARYVAGDSKIGFYGLEAKSESDADQREKLLRDIWARNASLNRTRVYRQGLVLVVVWIWTKDVVPECWEAVNAIVKERLNEGA